MHRNPARRLVPAILLLAPAIAAAQTTPNAPARPVAAQPDPCARERALLEAEATTPGILQRLAAEALQACLAQNRAPGR